MAATGVAYMSVEKLSTFVAPLNPSPAIACAAPITMNMSLPSSPSVVPTIGPCSVIMNVHPGPFTQPQSVSPRNYRVTSSTFHANHFTYLNPIISKFGPSAIWPSFYPVEFPLPIPIVESIPDPISESQVLCHGSKSPGSTSALAEDIDFLEQNLPS
ncbi:hypothetical protein JHK87_044908 [Glycine soja]|nr:hypothetical protein JHK87_044908 [Glycine soja]